MPDFRSPSKITRRRFTEGVGMAAVGAGPSSIKQRRFTVSSYSAPIVEAEVRP